MCRLNEQRAQIFAAAFRHASEDRLAASTVLPRYEPNPGGEVTAAIECFACADGRYCCRGDDGTDGWNALEADAVRLLIRQNLDPVGEVLDPLIQPQPILIKADDDVVHPLGDLIAPKIQDREQRPAKGLGSFANRNALLNQKSPDLVDRCRAP